VIQSLATRFPRRTLCRLLEVSPSGYYQWCRHQPGRRAQADDALFPHLKRAFEQSRQTYGSPRLTRCLQYQHLACSENRVARLMRRHHLQARSKRPFRPKTTDSRRTSGPAPNRLKAGGPPTQLNQVWVADLTYVHTQQGWVYLAAVMDLCSRRIVGWALGCSLHSLLVKDALQQALALRRPPPGLIHHSDRGVQYAAGLFQSLLRWAQILPSMSGRGNCYDNAAMESFWSTLKTELLQDLFLRDLPHASQVIHDYIEKFYNPKRLHSALGFLSPLDFEHQLP
jgi:transposase InsO family protein